MSLSAPLSTSVADRNRPVEPPVLATPSAGGVWMLAVMLAMQFMALVDVTIVNVAVPSLDTHLHVSGATLQLVVAGYTLTYAMLLLTSARLGNIRGHRQLFLAGTVLFTASSLVCGLAPDATVLVAARLTQGAGAALAIPQVISMIQRHFDGPARTRALSAYAAVLASGMVVGQVLGGLLVGADLFGESWRPVFLVNVPIGIAVVILTPRLVPADRTDSRRQLDVPGLLTASVGVGAVVLALILGHQDHWPEWCWISVAGGAALFGIFVALQRTMSRRGGDPLVDLDVLRTRGLVPALAALAAGMVAYGGFLFSLTLHLQTGLGDSPLRAGLTFAPAATLFGAAGYFWRRLPERHHRFIVPVGFLLTSLSYLLLAYQMRHGAQGAALYASMAFTGLAYGLAFSPLVSQALAHVAPAHAPDASGLFTTVLQLSQVVGVAILGSMFLTIANHHHVHPTAHAIAWITACSALLTLVGAGAGARLSRALRP